MPILRLIAFVIVGSLAGGGYGYLQSVKNEVLFRSMARFRVTSPIEKPAMPVFQIDAPPEQPADFAPPPPRRPVFREGDKIREPDVVRRAVQDGNLNTFEALGRGNVNQIADRLAASTRLHVGVVALAPESAIFELRFDSIDADAASHVVNSLLAAYVDLHFKDQSEIVEGAAASDMALVHRLFDDLDSAESKLNQRLDDWSRLARGKKSIDEYRDEIASLRKQFDSTKSERLELESRLRSGRELMKANRPLSDVLAAVRGDESRVTDSERIAEPESIRDILKSDVTTIKDTISAMDARLAVFDQRINEQSDAMRQVLASKMGVEESQRLLEALRRQYDEASGRLSQLREQKDFVSSPRFEIVQSASRGTLIDTGIPAEIITGLAWGGGIGAALSIISWAASVAVRERRRRAW